MKRTLSIALLLGVTGLTYAQETVKKTDYITPQLREKYTVFNTDKKVRQGEYVATLDSKPVATGNYTDGKRSGEWNFYNTEGKLVQTYNYDSNKIAFLDIADVNKDRYIIEKTDPSNVVSTPVKIGGNAYSTALLMYSRAELEAFAGRAMAAENISPANDVNYTHILTVNEQGYVVKHQVNVVSGNLNKTCTLNDSKLDPELTRFVPAMVNHQPVMSMVVVTSKYNADSTPLYAPLHNYSINFNETPPVYTKATQTR